MVTNAVTINKILLAVLILKIESFCEDKTDTNNIESKTKTFKERFL